MLLDDIQKSIADMNEIQQLEQASKDSQKQDNADKLYSQAVYENHKVITVLDDARKYLKFSPSDALISQIKNVFGALHECISTGLVQEHKARGLSSTIKTLKDTINDEWNDFYSGIADKRISKLTTVQSITPDKIKTGYAITKIKNGASINYADSSNLRLFSDGIKEADAILESLELTDEILSFLDKVVERRATILDLTESVEKWIHDESLTTKFYIRFES